MDRIKRENLVNKIIFNTLFLEFEGKLYRLDPPTKSQRGLANYVYDKVVSNNKFEGFTTKEQLNFHLSFRNIWNEQSEKRLKELEEVLETLKVNLYRALYKKQDQKAIRKQIKSTEGSIQKLYSKKHSLDYMLLEYHATLIKYEFLTAICIVDNDTNNPIYTYDNFWNSDDKILQKFLVYKEQNGLSQSDLRYLARSDPFRGMWSLAKENVFNISPTEFSEDQKNIVIYSRMYDSIYENPERPTEDVIEDDDMLDGWIIMQRKNAEKDRKQREADNILGKKGVSNSRSNSDSAGEIFIFAESGDDAGRVKDLNDINAQRISKIRSDAIAKKGTLEEHELPDVQLELQQQAMKQMSERRG
jgi:hypothetical protein